MPELPEVETVARSLDARVRGRKIVSVWLGAKPEPFRSTPADIAAALTGSTIQRAHRVGKHIVVDLARDSGGNQQSRQARSKLAPTGRRAKTNVWRAQWLVHLGMTGRLLVCTPDVPQPPHTHAVAQLDDGREIRFVDARRFGRLAVLDLSETATRSGSRNISTGGNISAHRNISKTGEFVGPGQEPLDISPEAFQAVFRGRRTPIKSALLNQSLLHGVGNIYADESLFRAGIRPRRHAGRLKQSELLTLRAALQGVLREAVAMGGSSVSDYVDADGARGFFQLEHKVYGRGGEPCRVCGTPIVRIVLGGRSTHFCPKCQH